MDIDNDFVLTFDIDWAPDFVIDYVANILIDKQVKATWFVTHQSAAIDRLRENSHLFELGIHPNLLKGSSHGATEDTVLSHVLDVVPGANSMRTHGLYQTSNFLVKASVEYGIAIDVSLFIPRALELRPHQLKWNGSSLWRIPYFWEDDSEMFEDSPIWDASDQRLNISGLRVLDFHPIHIILNTENISRYDRLKRMRPLKDWDQDFIKEHANKGPGPKNLFLELTSQLAGKGRQINELIQ